MENVCIIILDTKTLIRVLSYDTKGMPLVCDVPCKGKKLSSQNDYVSAENGVSSIKNLVAKQFFKTNVKSNSLSCFIYGKAIISNNNDCNSSWTQEHFISYQFKKCCFNVQNIVFVLVNLIQLCQKGIFLAHFWLNYNDKTIIFSIRTMT